ncbi:hypothetical protein H105_08036 [Trichophyton soudanense CBS 452.61]|uniref:Cytochrome P450 n=1 Tax=Trichophyton soudanense CBS 452.61 TaxID=1215331 RepID=A0A022XGL6_TRISD|nr:hypothetical protein H105_08036 [Trichophyton soudanense CBS 452.61]EZG01885.1 hypothetical protein H106_07928 [Trichophyton rubrum CBS 735.88]
MAFLLARAIRFYRCNNSSKNKASKSTVHFSDAKDCRAVIVGRSPFNGMSKNTLTAFQARAGPNQALRRAFGIDNAFTSEDNAVIREFVALATKRMILHGTDWGKVATLAATTLETLGYFEQIAGNSTSTGTVPITSVAQVLCLTVVLRTILQTDVDKTQYKDVLKLAEDINRIWISSKSPDEEKRSSYQSETPFHDTLKAIFPNTQISSPASNPLNLILPSFETMWRIVSRTFLEINFLTGNRSPEFKQVLVEFFHNPTKEQFNQELSPGISASNVISEALRLFPPTRRVHRHFQGLNSNERTLFAADIEACHRNLRVWGSDALKFVPGRWNCLNEQQKSSFMPFGSKPFLCPAKPVFGPRMIALLVGALLCHYTENWELSSVSGKYGINMVAEGEYLDRDACAQLYLVRDIRV